ncbi:MAG: hypothetical protein JOS17DRAFT_245975 [Linnemannia elongata]|nr:MAG: hypothetical protein JOS17DRAFT_245975 [Linnemannia elongata]
MSLRPFAFLSLPPSFPSVILAYSIGLVFFFGGKRKDLLLCCPANRSSLSCALLPNLCPAFFLLTLPSSLPPLFLLCASSYKLPSFISSVSIGSLQPDTQAQTPTEADRETLKLSLTQKTRHKHRLEQPCEANKQLDRILKSTTLLFPIQLTV